MNQFYKNNSHIVMSGVSLTLFISSIICLQFQMIVNNRLESDLDKVKSNDLMLLSEKRALEVEIAQLKANLISNSRSYEESNQFLAATFAELDSLKKNLIVRKNKSEILHEMIAKNSKILKE